MFAPHLLPSRRTRAPLTLFVLGALVSYLAYPSEATAQLALKPNLLAIDSTQIERNEPLRDRTDFPYWVSRSDCVADDTLTFRLQIQNPSSDNFEVWAGTADCSSAAERQGDLANCWRVFRSEVTRSPASIPIRTQDIVAQNGPATGNNGAPGTERDCSDQKYISMGLYFMYVNDAGQVSSNVITFTDTGIDLKGPIPPTLNSALAADDALILKWQNDDPTDFRGYRLYCEQVANEVDTATQSRSIALAGPLLHQSVADSGIDGAVVSDADAGLADGGGSLTSAADSPADAASDAGGGSATTSTGTSTSSCGGARLTEGQSVPDDAVLCGTIDTFSASSGYAKGLKNGTRYAVGVTAVDRLGNESDVSNVLCSAPREVYTFYEDYRAEGGGGGGGICNVTPVRPSPQSSFWFTAGLAVTGIFLRLRRRRNDA